MDQCNISLKTKLKGTKGYTKAQNKQDGINILEIIRSIVCGMEAHLQGTWDTMKSNKCLYTFFQWRNTTRNDYMKDFYE